jgi:histone-lysine N-methyltransferase SETMAR
MPEPELKNDLHPKKVMLSILWDFQGVIYYELRPPNTTVDSKLYCTQLENLKVALQAKRPERRIVWLLHDNARPHTSKVTRQKLEELGCELLPPSTVFTRLSTLRLPLIPLASQSSAPETLRR